MGKRYVFWRLPNGKPYRGKEGTDTTDAKHAMVEMLAEIGKNASPAEAGISFPGMFLPRLETALKPTLVIITPEKTELNERDSWPLIWAAMRTIIRKSGGGTAISPDAFLREADSEAAAFFRKPALPYVLVSGLSVASLPAKPIVMQDATINDLDASTRRFPLPSVIDKHEAHSFAVKCLARSKNRRVFVETHGRSIHDATERALTNLTLLRGLWTFFSTYGSWTYSFGESSRKALGVIHAGPVHTLHNPDGTSVEDLYWYEPEMVENIKLYSPPKGWGPIERERRFAMRRLASLPYRHELEDLIGRYAVALDQLNLDIAFLHLWSILEKLTDTVGASYDDTIKRAVWAYKDRRFASEMLWALRLHRNRLVHAAHSGGDERDQVVYMIKSFVEPHLWRLMVNDFKVESIEEYGKHLALPSNLDTLERQRRRLQLAERLVRKWEKKHSPG